MPPNRSQGHWWILTIPQAEFLPYLPPQALYIRGQLECGEETGYLHWQVVVYFRNKSRRAGVTKVFGSVHSEPTRSDAARDYVWKEDTRVEGTQFELGELPIRANNALDWKRIWDSAKRGSWEEIPENICFRYYGTIQRIAADHVEPVGMVRSCRVFWGPSGVGKSWRARQEAGSRAYYKDPRSKFWCGYRGQENVVIDEFRGGIDVAHMLRWLDEYPVTVEIKGASIPLSANRYWITSNLEPKYWYPELDEETLTALLRRLEVFNIENLDQ